LHNSGTGELAGDGNCYDIMIPGPQKSQWDWHMLLYIYKTTGMKLLELLI